MPVLPDEIRVRLPPLFAQEADDNPIIYARLFLPGTDLNWYVLEGQTSGAEFIFGCAFAGNAEFAFGHFAEQSLELFRGPNGELVKLDEAFVEGRLTDVVPAPEL